MKTTLLSLLASLLFLTATGYASEASDQGEKVATQCEDPRPEVCTMDYRPVCGNLAGGGVKTYSNGCGACSDANVTSWVEGECPK